MAPVRSLETNDLDQIAGVFTDWDHQFDQLGRGRFHGRIRFTDVGGVQVFDATLNRAIRCRGLRSPGTFTFSPVLPANADSLWRGRVLRPGMINVVGPHHEMDHRTNPDYRQTAITVPGDRLERVASALLGVEVHTLFGRDSAPLVDARRLESLVGRLRAVLRPAASCDDPSPGADPDELVADLLRTLAAGRLVDPFRMTPADRRRVVREAEAFALATPSQAVTVLQLCERTGVSERTLHYAFVEVTGLSPKAYLKTIRLNRARAELTLAKPRPGLVEAVARRHGFDRPGNFASDFRRMFGELPSQAIGSRRG